MLMTFQVTAFGPMYLMFASTLRSESRVASFSGGENLRSLPPKGYFLTFFLLLLIGLLLSCACDDVSRML